MPREMTNLELARKAGYASVEAYNADMAAETAPGALQKRRQEHRERVAEAEAAQAVELAKRGSQGDAKLHEERLESLAKACSAARHMSEAAAHSWLSANSGEYRDTYTEFTKARRTSPTIIEDLPLAQQHNIALTEARSKMTEMVRVYATTHPLDFHAARRSLAASSAEFRELMLIADSIIDGGKVTVEKAQDLSARVERIVKLHRERGESAGATLQRLAALGHTGAVECVRELLA